MSKQQIYPKFYYSLDHLAYYRLSTIGQRVFYCTKQEALRDGNPSYLKYAEVTA